MGEIATFFQILTGVASVGAAVESANAQKRAAKLQKQQRELMARQERRRLYREMQLKRAMAMANAAAAGTYQSSGAFGGVGAMTSQLGSSFGFQTQHNSLSSGIEANKIKAMDADLLSGIFGTGFDIATRLK